MGENKPTKAAFAEVFEEVKRSGGDATLIGKQRHREGKGLHELVDPKGFGGIRFSRNRFEHVLEKWFRLNVAQAMLLETLFDTTGSMGHNVQLAFDSLPRAYHLLMEAVGAPLARYDLQIISSIFGDVVDNYVLQRSQAEMDIKIAEELRMMVPESEGGDTDEDPQYGLFAAAYLTAASIVKTGLKSYHFTVTDAPGRSRLSSETLIRVFGEEVFDRVHENGYQIDRNKLPSTNRVVIDLLKISHAFVIQVGDSERTRDFWQKMYGSDRIVTVSSTRYLPEIEAAVIGLTEGTLTLKNVEKFLMDEAKLSKAEAMQIKRAVAGIPIGAQANLPNFDKMPVAGDLFASKEDVWPTKRVGDTADEADEGLVAETDSKDVGMWD